MLEVIKTAEIFETSARTVKVLVGSHEESVQAPVSVSDIKEIAKKYGIGRFVVKDESGVPLDGSDFPFEGTELKIEQYNEAK